MFPLDRKQEDSLHLTSLFLHKALPSLSKKQSLKLNHEAKKMNSEDMKRSITGGVKVENDSYYRKSSPAAAAPPGKKIIIKNADMKDDMQKEAVDIAIAVSSLSLT